MVTVDPRGTVGTCIGTIPNGGGVRYAAGVIDWHAPALQEDQDCLY